MLALTPALLRACIVVLLGLGLLLGVAGEPRNDDAIVVTLSPSTDAGELLTGVAPDVVVRDDARVAPTPAELQLLEALGTRSPLLVALPESGPTLLARPPDRPRAGRAAGIHFTARGSPGEGVLVHLRDAAGAIDSLRLPLGPDGRARGGFRVRPERAGWHAWELSANGQRGVAGAWVRERAAPHLLVATGTPDWESRFIARALEEAGAQVTLAQPLGRGLAPDGGPATLPSSVAELAIYDVVLVLGGAALSSAQLRALRAYVSENGGGALAAGHAATAMTLGVASIDAPAAMIPADALTWRLPLELIALPAASFETTLQPLRPATPSAVAVATTAAGAALVLAPAGRGRVAALGLTDTWRWRMEAGRIDEHREFWRSLADWLAGGLRDSVSLHLAHSEDAPGERIDVLITGRVAAISLGRPDGTREWLSTAPAAALDTRVASFLARTPGVYEIATSGAPVGTATTNGAPEHPTAMAAFSADTALPASADAWARLTLIAHHSGGSAVPEDAIESTLAAGRDGAPRTWRVSPLLLFTLIVAAAIAEWTIRRVTGRA